MPLTRFGRDLDTDTPRKTAMRTPPDAEANGWETKLHQALSSSAGHFGAQCMRVSSCDNDVLLQTPAAQELLPGGELSEKSW
jgi:hypothetical protein